MLTRELISTMVSLQVGLPVTTDEGDELVKYIRSLQDEVFELTLSRSDILLENLEVVYP